MVGAALALVVTATVWAQPPAGDAVRPPALEVRAPEVLARDAVRVRGIETGRLLAVMRLVGLDDPGPPIRVTLVPESDPLARRVPAAIAGFARDGTDVVLFPQRTPTYPASSMDDVVQHEVAHVLIDRAAGGRPVPRWFHEGVALAAERTWGLRRQADFAWGVAVGGPVSLADLDRLFAADPPQWRRAYGLSEAVVQDLLARHGRDLPARVLAAMREDRRFRDAFAAVTGLELEEAGADFWHRRRLWVIWFPWLTSPTTLYSVIGLLALLAALRVRARRAEQRRLRELEEMELLAPDESSDIAAPEPPRRNETVH
jgi:hypothetical protein